MKSIFEYWKREHCVCVFYDKETMGHFLVATDFLPFWEKCEILAMGFDSEGFPMLELNCAFHTVDLLDRMTTIRKKWYAIWNWKKSS